MDQADTPEAARHTTVAQRMLLVLADGMPHSREELHACLVDDLSPVSNIRVHIHFLRKLLRSQGQDIVCEVGVPGKGMKAHYRHVRLLASASDGRT